MYAIVGAGPSGLAVARWFAANGIPFVVLERYREVGGLWNFGAPHSAVYQTAHLISSKRGTEYPDFPMPDSFPDYPHHTHVLEYMKSYARAFNLYPHIRFETEVQWIERATGGNSGWTIRTNEGHEERFDAVVIANGHLWDPILPQVPGQFDGITMHSAHYKSPDLFADKKVLIVGSGNSGCDIVVDAVHRAQHVSWSVRTGNHFVPKYLFGKPADSIGSRGFGPILPLALRNVVDGALLQFLMGKPERFGLPNPEHRIYDRVPIVNSHVLHYLGHGDVHVRKPIERLDGNTVVYQDGFSETIDVIVYCTGFRVSFPFIHQDHLAWYGDAPGFYLHIFHPEYNDLFIAGLLESASGGFGTRHHQAELIAAYAAALARNDGSAELLQRAKRGYKPSYPARSGNGQDSIFIDYAAYKKELKGWVRKLSAKAKPAVAATL